MWDAKLVEAIKTFTNPEVKQIFEASQDAVYGGKVEKWAKLANSVRLKIAARLISADFATAKAIVEDVVNNQTCGILNGEEDDFLFNKATYNSTNNDYAYHWNNGVLQSVAGSQSIIDLMIRNLDPRVRFIFQKNDWNSKVVQLFFWKIKRTRGSRFLIIKSIID